MTSHEKLLSLVTKKSLSDPERRELITLMRATGADMPDLMFETAYTAYRSNPNSQQRYLQLEQLLYSGMQLQVPKSALGKFLAQLRRSLGDNTYVRRFSRLLEHVYNYDPEVSPLTDLMREDLTDNETLKKQIASSKKDGKIDVYLEKLNSYLAVEPSDEQAWVELAELYTERGHYMKAAFCYEELMVINPSNDVYALRLSELYLTLGNKRNTDQAIKYLSYLVTKRPDNLRALWALYRAVLGQDDEHQDLRELCYEAINKLYSRNNPAVKLDVAF